MKNKVLDLFHKSGRRAGYRMLKDMLKEQYGLIVNHKKVLRIMQELGIASIIRKKFKINRGKENIKKNIINRNFESDKP